MSYCRFDSENSDVYMYPTVGGCIECCGCSLDNPSITEFRHFYKRSEAIEHLNQHKAAGDKVPRKAFVRLHRETAEMGDLIR